MSSLEPKRHHYIPQFILRNFNDENMQVNYWDIAAGTLEKRNTRSVFMNIHMYRDELNHPENPTITESGLAAFEAEIAGLIKRFLSESQIEITREELEKLRIFLTLLSFRSDLRMNQYKNNNFDSATRSVLENYANGDFYDLWKREMAELARCRSYQQIQESSLLDPIIKNDFMNDLKGYYMTVVETRGQDFLISDVYPTLEICPMEDNLISHTMVNMKLHRFYPISPSRMLVLNHIMFRSSAPDVLPLLQSMKRVSRIRGDWLTPPKNKYVANGIPHKDDKYIYKVCKVYAQDIEYINALFLNEARVGIVFQNAGGIEKSVEAFNRRSGIKQLYTELERRLHM